MFTEKDIKQIEAKSLTLDKVQNQLKRFQIGFPPVQIISPATIEDGILQIRNTEDQINIYENSEASVIKFVPASGAATRMFKVLYSFLGEYDGSEKSLNELRAKNTMLDQFFSHISNFAFFEDLSKIFKSKHDYSINDALENREHDAVVESLLNETGLNYGNLPKGLLKFHTYETDNRTPVEEHLSEAISYATRNNEAAIHFTVSPEHLTSFKSHSDAVLNQYPNITFIISYSIQNEKTDTIAATPQYDPFRDEEGKLLFRPAGHGALLENLNEIDADIIFIKNIDNVVPDKLKEETIKFKKVLAGILISYQQRVFDLLNRHDQGQDITGEAYELLNKIGLKGDISQEQIPKLLNRPIRVCGMVKNEGEPGGGPFWVKKGNYKSLQIIESAQVDKKDVKQKELFEQGTHFNPVDLVLGVKNYRGEKFDLIKYRDEDAGFISEKSYNGEKLLAMELPGLWNGGMAYWNTIFVEVPSITFNPVKTVTDLLRDSHS